jgi:hypothetical protein
MFESESLDLRRGLLAYSSRNESNSRALWLFSFQLPLLPCQGGFVSTDVGFAAAA